MRGMTVALLLAFGAVSAVSTSIGLYLKLAESTSTCVPDSSEGEDDTKAVFQKAGHRMKVLGVR